MDNVTQFLAVLALLTPMTIVVIIFKLRNRGFFDDLLNTRPLDTQSMIAMLNAQEAEAVEDAGFRAFFSVLAEDKKLGIALFIAETSNLAYLQRTGNYRADPQVWQDLVLCTRKGFASLGCRVNLYRGQGYSGKKVTITQEGNETVLVVGDSTLRVSKDKLTKFKVTPSRRACGRAENDSGHHRHQSRSH